MKRVAFYLRVSTGSSQTLENQRRELKAIARRHNWRVVDIFQDKASGASQSRVGFLALETAIARRNVDLVAAWSVDRLSRSLADLIAFLETLRAKGVDLYLHRQGLDTSTPGGKAMFQILGVFAEFERAILQERVKAGLARARAEGKILGRPKILPAKELAIRADIENHPRMSNRSLCRKHRVGSSTVQRIKAGILRESPSRSS